MEKKINFTKSIIEILICANLVWLSIKKGGFYASDSAFFVITTFVFSFIYFALGYVVSNDGKEEYKKIKKNEEKEKKDKKEISKKDLLKSVLLYLKNNIINILIFSFLLSYIFAYFFSNKVDLDKTFDEILRISSLVLIYFIVLKSKNKEYYINTIILIGIIHSVIGIDGISMQFMESHLRKFKTGFLKRDVERMSSTIQYANTLAIICYTSLMLLVYKYQKYIVSKSENKSKSFKEISKDKLKSILTYVIFGLLLSTIIFTGSRIVYLITFISIIYIILSKEGNRLKKFIYILSNIILTFIYTATITKYLYIKSEIVYYIFLLYLILLVIEYVILNFLIDKIGRMYFNKNNIKSQTKGYSSNKESNDIKKNRFFKKILVISLVTLPLLIYSVLSLNISKPLVLNSDIKTTGISRQLTKGVKYDNTNEVKIKLKDVSEDAKFKIKIVSENDKYERILLLELDSSDINNENNKKILNSKFDILNYDSKLYVISSIEKGSLKIEDIYLNGQKNMLEYALLPSDFVFRIKSMLYKSESFDLRVEYSKDALKLINKNPVFGYGSDGFKDNYKEVQEQKYTSSEVHNSFLQLGVEIGTVGLILVIITIIITVFNKKRGILKYTFVFITIHSIFDLNFSYLLFMIIYYILIAYMSQEEKIKN